MDNSADEMVAMAVSATPKGFRDRPVPSEPKTSKPKKQEEPAPVSGLTTWTQGTETRFIAKFPREVSEWNRKDLVRYIAHVYYEATGASYIYALLMDYQNLQDFEHRLRMIGKCEPTNQMLKDYIDYTFKKHIAPMLGRGKKMNTRFFCSDQFAMDFIENYRAVSFTERKAKSESVKVDEITTEVNLNLRSLEDAYAINSRFFELNFGPIIHVNFLMMVKGISCDQAVKLASVGIDKAILQSPSAKDEIKTATARFEYPRWLPFTDVDKLKKPWLSEIVICDDNEMLGFLKPFSKKEV